MTSGPVDVDAAVEPLFTPSFFDLDRLVADEANGSQGSLPDILQPPAAASSFSTTLGLEIDYVFAPIAGPSTYWPPGPPPLLPSTLGNAPPTTTGVPSKWPATLYMPSAEVTRLQQKSAASPACAWAGDPPRSSMAGVLAESHTTPGGGQSLREWLRTQAVSHPASSYAPYPISAFTSPSTSFTGLPTPPDQRRSSLPYAPDQPHDLLPAVAARAAAKWREFTRSRAGPSLSGLSSALPSSPPRSGVSTVDGGGSSAHSPTASSSTTRSHDSSTSSRDDSLLRSTSTTLTSSTGSGEGPGRSHSTAASATSSAIPAGPVLHHHHLQRTSASRYEPYATISVSASASTTRRGSTISIATTSTTSAAAATEDASGSAAGKTKEELKRERKRVTNRNSARNQREKKRLEIESLQAQLAQSDAQLAQLRALEQSLRVEHEQLSG